MLNSYFRSSTSLNISEYTTIVLSMLRKNTTTLKVDVSVSPMIDRLRKF